MDNDDNISLTSTVIDNPDRENNVEEILAKRDFYDRAYYLVKWEGFPIEQATWEPIESFSTPKEAIDFWEHTQAAIDRGDEHSAELVARQQDAIEAVRVREERRKRRRELRARLAENRVRGWDLKREPREEEDGPASATRNHLQSIPTPSTPAMTPLTPAGDMSNTVTANGAPLSPLEEAAQACREGRFANPHQAAKAHNVDYNALRTRLGLTKNSSATPGSAETRYKRLKKLTDEEEKEVANYFLARRHDPLPKSEIAVKATEILRRRDPSQSVSQGWIDLFLKRQHDLRRLYPPSGTKRKSTLSHRMGSPPRLRSVSDTPEIIRSRHRPVDTSDVEGSEATTAATAMTATTAPTTLTTTDIRVIDMSGDIKDLSLRPGPDTVRFKLRTDKETRYMLVKSDVELEEFLHKIRIKLGIRGQFKLHMKDEGDMVTIGDQEDLNILLALAKEGYGAEIWAKQW